MVGYTWLVSAYQRRLLAARDLRIAATRSDPYAVALKLGPFTGEIAARYRTPDLVAWLAELPSRVDSPSARVLGAGRNRHVRIDAPILGLERPLMVKAFGPLPLFRDLRDRRRGSKAQRTWLAAHHLSSHGVGTPPPIGYLERWEGGRLRESYFLALHQEQAETLRDALVALFHDHPEFMNFMALLECVADGVRAMHDVGFIHNDLGNQNILLRPDGPGRWSDFQVVDLNRGRIRGELPLRERARDLSRMALPSHFMQLFLRRYWGGAPPTELVRWENHFRRLHGWHVRSRRWRHPFREARIAREARREPASRNYPAPRDMWIWDERSAQPISAMLRADRVRHYPRARSTRMVVDTLRAAASVWRAYRPLLDGAFGQPVDFAGRIGMAVEPSTAAYDRQLELLAGLGRIPALVRFYHHESPDRRRLRVEFVRALHHAGHPVAIALVQDREAVLHASSWRNFAAEVLENVGPLIELVEVAHGINRTKWGVWDFADLAALYAPIRELHVRFPAVRFMGPAAIDFEYPFVLSALREWPKDVPLAALSHHLYVDRRGAPENPQGRLGALEKFALARAMARTGAACADRLVVSEVNWPLQGAGAYSPVSGPDAAPGQGSGGAAVNEDDYANYMLRYLCLAIGSGLVDRVYWWRLVARGFGLVDDTNPAALRPRAAYPMLRAFLHLLGSSTLINARLPGREGNRHGRYRLAFRREDGETVVLTYAHGPAMPFPPDEHCGRIEDSFGEPLVARPRLLTGRPLYLRAGRA